MPIIERDPWREQYFRGVACPDDVIVPTDDTDSWLLYPAHRWVYSKLLVAETQGLAHAPHGIAPDRYPVFSKPVMNLRGMGTGSQAIASAEEYARLQQPGHMWMELLDGEHVSSDAAVLAGEPAWWRHVCGVPAGGGTFDRWQVEAAARPALEAYLSAWIRRNLASYTGCVNFETIGGRIIELHLRFSDQWPDLYGAGWIDAVVRLHCGKGWDFADGDRRDGWSVILFGPHLRRYRHPPRAAIDEALAIPGVSSVQITFHDDRAPESHAMPPGGFRLAIVNAWDLGAGRRARAILAAAFGL
ncbi:MAG: hypothetical protein JNK11_00685 [Alphaproteobacteria bacterium]|nr:hypothetical protein [Alphaproteobacteria bacterium]